MSQHACVQRAGLLVWVAIRRHLQTGIVWMAAVVAVACALEAGRQPSAHMLQAIKKSRYLAHDIDSADLVFVDSHCYVIRRTARLPPKTAELAKGALGIFQLLLLLLALSAPICMNATRIKRNLGGCWR